MGRSVVITGAGGYLGGRLVSELLQAGYEVRAAVRRGSKVSLPHGVKKIDFSLGESPPAGMFQGGETLIHCAYDFSPRTLEGSLETNANGSRKLFEAARANDCGIIFISSMAAFEGCSSIYGKTKLAGEKEALERGAWVLRPGTIYSPNRAADEKEGLFGALRKLGTKLPVVPLIGSGKQELYVISVNQVAKVILGILASNSRPPSEPISIAELEPVTFKELIATLAKEAGRKPIFIPLPTLLFLGPMRVAEAIGINLPFRSDSLVSLLNPNPAPKVVTEIRD